MFVGHLECDNRISHITSSCIKLDSPQSDNNLVKWAFWVEEIFIQRCVSFHCSQYREREKLGGGERGDICAEFEIPLTIYPGISLPHSWPKLDYVSQMCLLVYVDARQNSENDHWGDSLSQHFLIY